MKVPEHELGAARQAVANGSEEQAKTAAEAIQAWAAESARDLPAGEGLEACWAAALVLKELEDEFPAAIPPPRCAA